MGISFAWMIGFFGMSHHILFIKQNILKLAFCVHEGLIGEMFGRWVAAFSTGQQRFSADPVAKFNCTDKAVAIYTIAFFGARKAARGIGRQHAPHGRRKWNSKARLRIVILLADIARDALKAIDITPGQVPFSVF